MSEISSRYLWNFGDNTLMLESKETLIDFHINMALTKTLTMFEYDDLPESIPVRELEKIIQLNSFAYWLEKDNELYVFFGGLGGRPNVYYQPTQFIVANPYLQYFDTVDVNKEGVLMWNDYAHMGMYPLIRRYAELMAECDITLRFGLINDRIVSIIEAINDKQKAEAELFLKDVVEGRKLGVMVGKSFLNDDGQMKVNSYRQANHGDLKDVMELQQYIKASFYNDIGLQANYNMKREAINDSEASMNEEALKPFCDDMLKCRREALEKINKQFGTNITVRFSSSWVARNKLDVPEEKKEEQIEIVEEQTPVTEGGIDNV